MGIEEKYRQDEEDRKKKLAREWGGESNAWDRITDSK